MTLKLYNSLTNSTDEFVALTEGVVGIYVCGMTVQGPPHVGHLRSAVVFDVLRRFLLSQNYRVDFVRNITDVDDKIITAANIRGIGYFAHASEMIRISADIFTQLNIMPPTYEPLATGHMPQMWDMIAELIKREHAYVARDGSVYFDTQSYDNYGTLTNQRPEAIVLDDDNFKRNSIDFALWKAAKDTDPVTASWNSPWGAGRPGWHIECSAMSTHYLGEKFDIHGGGIDLRFPHHENEIAQANAAGYGFANLWMHNAHVETEGMKLGKSLGNAPETTELINTYGANVIRWYLLGAHYRSALDFSPSALEAAKVTLDNLIRGLRMISEENLVAGVMEPEFVAALSNDLDTHSAVTYLIKYAKNTAANDIVRLSNLQTMLDVLGIDVPRRSQETMLMISELVSLREAARKEKNFATSDRLRDVLHASGVEIFDTPDGPAWV